MKRVLLTTIVQVLRAGLMLSAFGVGTTLAVESNIFHINLSAALRLAGAQNLDVRVAEEKLKEAQAHDLSATWNFLPWLSASASYRQHDGLFQDAPGNILDVHKYAYEPGATLGGHVDIGEALYRRLETKLLVRAAQSTVDAERQQAVALAATTYFDLLRAQASWEVARESVGIASNQEAQVASAVAAGMALKMDQLRAQVQLERYQLLQRRKLEEKQLAAAELRRQLHLDPAVELLADNSELVALDLLPADTGLASLQVQARKQRPDLSATAAATDAARKARTGAVYGPLIPRLDAEVFLGALGGGRQGAPSAFGDQEDYAVGLSWRFGPGGLFDVGRVRAAESRLRQSQLEFEKLTDRINSEVTQAFAAWQSARDQLHTATQAIDASEVALRLANQRREFAVGAVLENLQAAQDWTSARDDYLRLLAAYNTAQYRLLRAAGRL